VDGMGADVQATRGLLFRLWCAKAPARPLVRVEGALHALNWIALRLHVPQVLPHELIAHCAGQACGCGPGTRIAAELQWATRGRK
jgi:hypothetical protein